MQVTLWVRTVLQKISDSVCQENYNYSPFTEPEGSLPYPKQPAARPYPQPDELSPRRQSLLFKPSL